LLAVAISISAAGPGDVDAVVASVAGLFQEDGGRHDAFMLVDWPEREGAAHYRGIVDDPATLLVLARDGGRVVGHLVGKLSEPSAIRTGRFAVLESMRVAPDARGRGIGTRLVAEFFAWARESGAERASVTAFAANDGAQRFYARHGFAPHAVTFRAAVG
jgi:GNAT superfamily N-acetyltransferase